MQKINWNDVQESNGNSMPGAGGYILKVVGVNNRSDKECLDVQYDFAEGDNKDLWRAMVETKGWNYPIMYRSYKQTAQGMFKNFLNTLERCNPEKFTVASWDSDEKKLIGLQFGAVLREEEYVNSEGLTKIRRAVYRLYNIEDIKTGKFNVPPIKTLPTSKSPTTAPAPVNADLGDDSCPF